MPARGPAEVCSYLQWVECGTIQCDQNHGKRLKWIQDARTKQFPLQLISKQFSTWAVPRFQVEGFHLLWDQRTRTRKMLPKVKV
mmetsp:Transcript_40548/g.75365  ORF Transcript_40548/g.75365 Transcript_40548/m.75365 type:complete len:84 (-) Transcript_40548:28-279(-)